jgi:hypothetical protein
MGKRKKVPEDLMGTILGGGYASSTDEPASSESSGSQDTGQSPGPLAPSSESSISWESRPERMGVTFNLSKQVGRELDKLRLKLRDEENIRVSNSEIVEWALRLAIEDAQREGQDSELLKSLNKASADQSGAATDETRSLPAETTDGSGRTIRRSVDKSGYIVETTYDDQREIVSEEVVGDVADLPVEEEYLDEGGRLLSLAKDELGNVFERVTDEESNTLGVRLVRDAG